MASAVVWAMSQFVERGAVEFDMEIVFFSHNHCVSSRRTFSPELNKYCILRSVSC
jgi:hypothetical protein